MDQQQRGFTYIEMKKAIQGSNSDEEHQPDISEHEGPETEHLGKPRAASAFLLLTDQAHQDRQSQSIAPGRHDSLRMCHPLEQIDLASQDIHQGDQSQKYDQQDGIEGMDDRIPANGTDDCLEQEPHNKKASSDQETFFHFPRLKPHI